MGWRTLRACINTAPRISCLSFGSHVLKGVVYLGESSSVAAVRIVFDHFVRFCVLSDATFLRYS
jgi:hypothetical protein